MKKKIIVFDFDGTLTYFDTFKFLIILRAIYPKYWKSLFVELLKFFKHRDKQKFRVKLQEILWNDKLNRELFFNKIFNSIFFKFFIRKPVLEYCKSISKTETVLFLTANEKSIIKVFLQIHLDLNNKNIFVIGSDFKNDKFKIIKGIEKLNSLKLFLEKMNDKLTVYNFFDSYSDLYLTQICDVNVVVGTLNYYYLKRFNPNLIKFNVFYHNAKV